MENERCMKGECLPASKVCSSLPEPCGAGGCSCAMRGDGAPRCAASSPGVGARPAGCGGMAPVTRGAPGVCLGGNGGTGSVDAYETTV